MRKGLVLTTALGDIFFCIECSAYDTFGLGLTGGGAAFLVSSIRDPSLEVPSLFSWFESGSCTSDSSGSSLRKGLVLITALGDIFFCIEFSAYDAFALGLTGGGA